MKHTIRTLTSTTCCWTTFQGQDRSRAAKLEKGRGCGADHGIWAPTITSALCYYDGYRSERLPANLLQAQRDYFGATYERVDRPRGNSSIPTGQDWAQNIGVDIQCVRLRNPGTVTGNRGYETEDREQRTENREQ